MLSITFIFSLIWSLGSPSFLVKASVSPAGDPFMEGLNFERFDGDPFSFSEVEDKVVLLDFWATWCGPCRKAYPKVEKLYEQIDHPDFEVVTISIDHDEKAWKTFLAQAEWTGTHIHIGRKGNNPLLDLIAETITRPDGTELTSIGVPKYYLLSKSQELEKLKGFKAKEIKVKVEALLAE